MKRLNNFKKIIVLLLLIGFIANPVLPIFSLKITNAQFVDPPVAVNTGVTAVNTGITAGATGGTLTKSIAEYARKIAYALFKKVVLDRLVDSLVAWINRGGQGGIIEDWDQFFQDSANIAAGEFAQGLGAGFLCSPFNLHVQLALIPVDRFSKVTCTLNQIIGNINNFMEDFRNGSWLAYQETWYPRNNFYGGTIIAVDEAARAEALGRDAAEKEALAGRGFLSFTKEGYFISADGPYNDQKGTLAEPGYQGVRYKKDRRTVTPGAIVGVAAASLTVTTPINRIIHSDDLSLYLTAIVDAAINQLTKDGVKWLTGKLSSATRDTRVSPAFPCAGLTGEAFRVCQGSVNTERSEFKTTQTITQNTVFSSLETRNEINNVLSQSIALQTSYVETLEKSVAGGRTDLTQKLAEEQAILDTLQDKLESNLSITNQLQKQDDAISGITPATGITADNWIELGTNINAQYINDELDASEELLKAQNELAEIQNKVSTAQ
jgi:hypothetical protein